MKRIRSGTGRSRQQPQIGAPDPALTPNAGLAAITELCDQLGVIAALDAAVGPVKQRDRGFGSDHHLEDDQSALIIATTAPVGSARSTRLRANTIRMVVPVTGQVSSTRRDERARRSSTAEVETERVQRRQAFSRPAESG